MIDSGSVRNYECLPNELISPVLRPQYSKKTCFDEYQCPTAQAAEIKRSDNPALSRSNRNTDGFTAANSSSVFIPSLDDTGEVPRL